HRLPDRAAGPCRNREGHRYARQDHRLSAGRAIVLREEDFMDMRTMNRRTALKLALGLTAAGMTPARLFAQAASASRPAKPLPPRGEFLIRGATVLTMDGKLGDFERGDVHVRNGAIAAVAQSVSASGVETLDGRGMICMPGFIDTHWHLWTTAC